MSNPNSDANNKENISENPIPARRFACPHCPKTFSTSMAMGGHQGAHRKRREKQPIFSSQGASGLSSSPAWTMGCTGNLPLMGPVRESPFVQFSSNTRYLLDYFAARKRREEYLRTKRSPLSAPLAPHPLRLTLAPSPPPVPLAPRGQPRSTMFFGVPDLFKPSVAPNDASGDVASSPVAEEDMAEEEGEIDLDLDLKL